MDRDWEQRGIWVKAKVARSFVQRSGSAVHGWVRWADGTYGSFQGQSTQDVTDRFPPGSTVDVLVDPSGRAKTYRMALDGPANGPVEGSYAEPADEPPMVSGLLNAFSGGTGGKETPLVAGLTPRVGRAGPPGAATSPWPPLVVGGVVFLLNALSGGTSVKDSSLHRASLQGAVRAGPPRAADSPWPPLVVGVVLVLVGLLILRPFAAMGTTLLLVLPAGFCIMGLGLLASVLGPMLSLAALRRTGQRVPAVVLRSREVLASGGRSARFRWQVVAEVTIAGQSRELVSENLRDNPTDALPPGTMLTALVDSRNPTRYRLLLSSWSKPV